MTAAGFALLLCGAAIAQQGDEPYAWPLDLPRELTSSFGEYRPGRYHVGIDLRTGPIGKNVYAADDGYVVRIACSPYGYGKVVYVALKDGNVAVYAHLDAFAPPLDAYVRRAQHAARRYTVDLRPERNELKVTRGQLIATSGQTGIGVPHLHYEIRDGNHVPINPGVLGVYWPDSTTPVFRKVAIVPIEPESTVNGDVLPVIRDATVDAHGDYRIADRIRVSGPFAVAVDVFDPAPGGSKLGVYRISTGLNARPVFEITHDRLSYDNLNDGAAAYEPALRDRGQFLWQWRKAGNRSEIYPQGPHDGRMTIDAPGDVRIEAEDFTGNQAALIVNVVPDGPGPHAGPSAIGQPPAESRGHVSFDYTGAQFVVSVRFDADEPVEPVLRVDGAQPARAAMRRVDARTFRTAYQPRESYAEATLRVEHARVDANPERVVFLRRLDPALPWSADFGRVRLEARDAYAYATLALRVVPAPPVAAHEELTPVSDAFEIWPPNAILDGSVSLSVPMSAEPAVPKSLLLYRQTRTGWDALSREDSPGRLGARSAQLGTFAVMNDSVAPRIRVLSPTTATVTTRRPEIKAEITDGGSGIDTFTATLGDRWLLMEYDPEQDLLRWEQDDDLPAGAGHLVIEITDRAGNLARREMDLQIPN